MTLYGTDNNSSSLPKQFSKVTLPYLILHGGEDKVSLVHIFHANTPNYVLYLICLPRSAHRLAVRRYMPPPAVRTRH